MGHVDVTDKLGMVWGTWVRGSLGSTGERIEEEMALLKPLPPSLRMPLQWILPGNSDLLVRGSAFGGFGTAHKAHD